MNSKDFLKFSFLIVTFIASLTVNSVFGQDSLKQKQIIKEKLPLPFGTLATMKIEIVDGNELNEKGHQSSFLFRVKQVDSITLSKPIIIDFKDETGNFPNDDFELYNYLYGKKTGTISAKKE